MTLFSQLIGFHDPVLAQKMKTMGLNPDLFAISWFTTLFSRNHDLFDALDIFPFSHLVHLWDWLLVSPQYSELYLALGLIFQLRTEILNNDFNHVRMYLINDSACCY
jgi:TBC domain-containing protein kinase-like protein